MRLDQALLVSVGWLGVSTTAASAYSFTAYSTTNGTVGTQAYEGILGLDFVVDYAIAVTALGAFDDNSDGHNRPITVELWSRNGNLSGDRLATTTLTGALNTLDGGYRFAPLAEPEVLEPGEYTIVAYGYGAGEQNGNVGFGGFTAPTTNTGTNDASEPLISFVGGGRFGGTFGASIGASLDGGPANRYGAGSFKFDAFVPPVIDPPIIDPEPPVDPEPPIIDPPVVDPPSAAIPEPTTMLGIGLAAGLGTWVKRQRSRA